MNLDTNIQRDPAPSAANGGTTAEVSGGLVFNRQTSDFASSVVCTDFEKGPTQSIEVNAARAELRNGEGTLVNSLDVVLETRPEDVGGVVANTIKDGVMFVYGLECLRPALSIRQHLGLPALGGAAGNRVLGEIGGYLLEANGVTHGAEQILAAKTPLIPSGAFEYLGNLVTPNPGASTELSIASAVTVMDPGQAELYQPGERFESSRAVVRLRAQELVTRFFSGKLSDPRWLLDVLEVHANGVERGLLTGELSPPAILKTEVADRIAAIKTKYNLSLPLLSTPGEVLEFLNRRPKADEVQSVTFGDFQPVPDDGLYQTYRLAVENRNGAGKAIGEPYAADVVIRQHDMLDVIVLGKIGDSIVMPVNIGVRPALACRDRSPRVVHSITHERNLEGVTGSLTADYDDRAAVVAEVKKLVKLATGHEVVGEPMLTAMQGYWSPGYNATGFRVALAVIQLDEQSAARLPKNTALARPEALLDAHVRDLPLRLAAAVASMLIDQPTPRRSALNPDERPGFRELMSSSSQVDEFIGEHSRGLLDVKRKHPTIANIINKRLGAGGMQIERPDPEDPEKYFFNSLMQTFVIHSGDHPLRIGQLFVHDTWHYEHPDRLPFVRHNGKLVPVGFDRYRDDSVMFNEVDAVMFSEVVLPEIFGIARFEAEMDAASLASLLRNAGIVDRDAQRDAVAFCLEQGEMPEPVVRYMHESGIFARYEPLIREKLLGYYVRDKLQNVRVLYDAWTSMPEVAEVASAMGAKLMDSVENRPALYSNRLRRLITEADGSSVHTGRNPLREAIGHAKTYGIYQPALRLAYIRTLLDPYVHAAQRKTIDMAVASLVKTHEELEKARTAIASIEESPTNAAAYRLYLRAQKNVVEPARQLLEQLESDAGPLAADRREQLRQHRHAPFPMLSFDPRLEADAQVQVSRLIQNSYAKAGLPCPAFAPRTSQ